MTWLRSQRIALSALLFTVIAVVGVSLWLDILPVADQERVTVVRAEGDVEVAGQELRYRAARWDEFAAPEGARSVSIRLHSSGGPDAALCGEFRLSEADGGRTWLDAHTELDVPYDAGAPYCQEESAPYEILAVFLIPENADGPFVLDIPGEDDVVFRFAVEP
ncbi:hypothetical protein [Microbacterium tumbae]